MLSLFYLARLLGSPLHSYKAANAPIYVTHLLNPSFEPHRVKYGSATSINGMEYIQITDIDPTGFSDIYKYIDEKCKECDGKIEESN